MKIGMCMFLWTTNVGPEHEPLMADIRATGFDGVEIPVFEGTPDDYARLGRMLDGLGLDRTAVAIRQLETGTTRGKSVIVIREGRDDGGPSTATGAHNA